MLHICICIHTQTSKFYSQVGFTYEIFITKPCFMKTQWSNLDQHLIAQQHCANIEHYKHKTELEVISPDSDAEHTKFHKILSEIFSFMVALFIRFVGMHPCSEVVNEWITTKENHEENPRFHDVIKCSMCESFHQELKKNDGPNRKQWYCCGVKFWWAKFFVHASTHFKICMG